MIVKKYIDILNKIIRSALEALYQPFWAALLLACISMFVYIYGKEHQWKIQNVIPKMIKTW